MRKLSGGALAITVLVACSAGCTMLGDDTASSEEDISETNDLFGDDRVADALRGKLDKIPKDYAAAEKLFGVGRACARDDSKEIFVVEEAQTRVGGQATQTKDLLPRTIITGCNTPEHQMKETPTKPESGSFSLFIALFSDEAAPNAGKGDPMLVSRVETMALDRRTGLYNFYVFEKGVMQRFRLMPNNDVMVWTLPAGAKKATAAKAANRECNNCHVNMGPLMNEMREPWTNWISTRNELPAESTTLTGETRSIVSEAKSLDGNHGRTSFANALQKTLEEAIEVWVEGMTGVPRSGFVRANLDGDQPRGVKGLLESVFCQTELQYESSFPEAAPLELFIDPGVAEGGQFQRPRASSDDKKFPVLLPVRSQMDKRIEIGLIKADAGNGKRVITKQTQMAIRLFDEQNDVFSAKRCALYDKVKEQLPKDPSQVDAHIRSVLNKEIQGIPEGARRDYAKALLTDGADAGSARTKYLDDLRTRLATDVQKLETVDGRTDLKKRSQARKDAAEKMFQGDRVPLPLIPKEEF